MPQDEKLLPANEEAHIVINGVELTAAQSIAVRVGLSIADFGCGEDALGHQLKNQYLKRVQEIFDIMRKE